MKSQAKSHSQIWKAILHYLFLDSVGCSHPRVHALVGLGVPVATAGMSFLRGITKPKLLMQGTRDEFAPRHLMEALYDSLAAPKQIHWVQDGHHFFKGKTDEVQAVLRAFLLEVLARLPHMRE